MTTQTEEQQQNRWDYPIQDATKGEVRVRYIPPAGETQGQLTLNVGDIVWVLEESDGWCGGHKDGDENTGWFPASIINKIGRGDCVDEDEDDRKNSALYTSDHRAVASPQATHRKVSAQLELNETKQRLEAVQCAVQQVESERCRLEEQIKVLQKAQSEWEKERHCMMKKHEEQLSLLKVQAQEEGRRQAQEELQKQQRAYKEMEGPGFLLSVAESLLKEKATTNSLKGKLKELDDHCSRLKVELQKRPGEESGLSGSTMGISRTYAGDSGHRTPSVPHTVTGMLSGSLQAPPAPCPGTAPTSSMTSVNVGQVSASPLSARQPSGSIGARHASPRQHASWMPPMGSGAHPPSSPHLRQRVPSQRDVAMESSAPLAPVRSLVADFEKRSTSQGAPVTREVAPINRQLVFNAAPSPSSASTCCTVRRPMASVPVLATGPMMTSAVRTTSRDGQPVARTMRTVTQSASRTMFQVEADAETPNASPNVTHVEDPARNFGMSPIKRQAYTITRGGMTGHPMSYSPPSRPISVQDRIRQLNATRFR